MRRDGNFRCSRASRPAGYRACVHSYVGGSRASGPDEQRLLPWRSSLRQQNIHEGRFGRAPGGREVVTVCRQRPDACPMHLQQLAALGAERWERLARFDEAGLLQLNAVLIIQDTLRGLCDGKALDVTGRRSSSRGCADRDVPPRRASQGRRRASA
jgi:hypothetical protein